MKFKQVIAIFLITFGLILIGAQIRYWSIFNDIYISQCIFAVTAFILTRMGILKGRWKYLLIPLSTFFWYTFGFFFDNAFSNFQTWHFLNIGAPNLLLLCPVGATYGTLLASEKSKRLLGILVLLISGIFSYWYFEKGNEYWFNYVFKGTFTGKVKEEKLSKWQHSLNPKDSITADRYKDKFVVLDFWTMRCLACFKKFPKLDSLNKAYRDNEKVIFEAVNLPVSDDSSKFERVVELNKDYSFKTSFADSSAWRTFNIDGVPTVIILKNDEIVFRGSIELAKDFLEENVKP